MLPKQYHDNSIYWIEVSKIRPNPYQPRKEFDQGKLQNLAESIRQYGVLQPIVLTRHEVAHDDGSLSAEYELIAGERRWRASRIAGLTQIPAVIRPAEDSDRAKLELAIIENLQREDLNAVDRAKAFDRLVKEFNFKHSEVAQRVSKSREYVSNSLRLLALTEPILEGLSGGTISEGHARSLLMLADRPEEQETLYKEIVTRRLSVRETEQIARRLARDRIRKKEDLNPELAQLEKELTETLGTRVQIQQKQEGGKVVIEYFSPEDFKNILSILHKQEEEQEAASHALSANDPIPSESQPVAEVAQEDNAIPEEEEDGDMYSIKNFSI